MPIGKHFELPVHQVLSVGSVYLCIVRQLDVFLADLNATSTVNCVLQQFLLSLQRSINKSLRKHPVPLRPQQRSWSPWGTLGVYPSPSEPRREMCVVSSLQFLFCPIWARHEVILGLPRWSEDLLSLKTFSAVQSGPFGFESKHVGWKLPYKKTAVHSCHREPHTILSSNAATPDVYKFTSRLCFHSFSWLCLFHSFGSGWLPQFEGSN